ncbi:hypothetical protein SAMN05216413_1001 [Ruminococcaceae bacterium KH2T8]|nr:hypothetical protein SAMN05216413_1001 [Ruminococcaceae bacterium KH2T8]
MKKPSDNHKKITAAKIIAGVAATAALCLNVNGCVYGPGAVPEETESEQTTAAQETTEETTEETTTEETTAFDPGDNDNPDVYGPPDDFDPADNDLPAVYGPPEDMTEEMSEDNIEDVARIAGFDTSEE